MRLIITNNVSVWAGTYISNKINQYMKTQKEFNLHQSKLNINGKLDKKANKNFVLGLPTGSTAIELYFYLVKMYQKKQLSFKNVITFNMDEYINLPREHPQSYWTFMHENLFNHVDIAKENINLPNGMAADLKLECEEYDNKIEEIGGINLFVGGVGENGHLAFNEPYSSLSSNTRDKELSNTTLAANSRFFNEDIYLVPKSAITVGINTLLKAKEIIILVKGVKKSNALYHCVEGSVSHMWPISVLQFHEKAIIVADEEACNELKVKTYRYFKELKDEYSYINDTMENTFS
ncbi:Glucosamine-6-phosphate deaminase [Candidatus Hepatincolaceae symbiont of Richtersius coronifer]